MKSTEDFIIPGCSLLLNEAEERAKVLVKKIEEYRTYEILEGIK